MRRVRKQNFASGFTLIEAIVAIGIIILVAVGIFSAIQFTYKIIYQGRIQVLATQLGNEQLEIIRNLSYERVGIKDGFPPGDIPRSQIKIRSGATFQITATIRNIDDPFDGILGGSPNDLSPADYKLAEAAVFCASCPSGNPSIILSTRVSPKGLEGGGSGGALFITVFDAAGGPVEQANLHIEKDVDHDGAAEMTIDDVTNNGGELRLIDLPVGTEAYKITASKAGYSTDQTIVATLENPNPLKPPATIVSQGITNISFAIDKTSSFNLKTQNIYCQAAPSVSLSVNGSKIIGANPDIYKYNQTVATNSQGEEIMSNLEWDTYFFSLPAGSAYDLAGSIPALPVALAPDAQQDIIFILRSHTTNSLLVTAEDSATRLPLSGARVVISQGSFSEELTTGHGYLRQTDWSGGAGQADFINETEFWEQDGNLEINSPAGDITLKKFAGKYYDSGWLISSTFDTGTNSNFTNLIWEPLAQPLDCGNDSLKFQIATAATSTPASWEFKGPDGAAASYYTASDTNISAIHNGDRYLRYKVFLNTIDDRCAPQLSEAAVSFTSGCAPPGQAFFSGLSSGAYSVTVELAGYQTLVTETTVDGRTQLEILMSP